MAQRSVLCIEPDGAAVSEIRRAFGAYGFRVESIPNGEQAVEWARTNNPSLIILSVEPRKVGYAICNKLKRSPNLREIPLILISAEETRATFEQHKKLKSRAEEYLLKPLDPRELLAKANRLITLGDTAGAADDDEAEIEIADDEIAEVSLDDDELMDAEDGFAASDPPTQATARVPFPDAGGGASGHRNGRGNGAVGAASDDEALAMGESLGSLGDFSRPHLVADASGPSPFAEASQQTGQSQSGTRSVADMPFDSEQFDQETQAAFAALEAGTAEGVTMRAGTASAGGPSGTGSAASPPSTNGDVVDLQSLWGEADLPAKMPWEQTPGVIPASSSTADRLAEMQASGESASPSPSDQGRDAPGAARLHLQADDPFAAQITPPPVPSDPANVSAEDALLAGLGSEVPPLPEEVLYGDHGSADMASNQKIADLQGRLDAAAQEKRASEGRVAELLARISSLEAERHTLRKEQDELREQMTHAANQGAFSKERDLLGLREVINKKEKDILDLRDALDAKERLILDHKDKIRENERARRDLEERTLGFEKSLVAANEKVAELTQDREKSAERERGLKARLDDAHEELRKGQDEQEALRKRVAQEIERGRVEVEKVRIELEAKFADAEESHRATLTKATDEWAAAEAAEKAAHQTELNRLEAGHRVEVESLQRRLAEEVSTAAERLQNELLKLRRDQEKAIASLKEEQALQLASEREAYEAQTEAKHRAYRDEVMGLRRRHEEELAAAEDRRQRDILEQEQRRVAELEQAETRRRMELQARDEEHHGRVTDLERRHLIEKTELGERHRVEYDAAAGRAVRAEGELVARAQEIEQAYRRLAGFEADLDAARAELGDRDVKLSQFRDRVSELETKTAEYEEQILRAFQRLRTEERTTEKVRRALAVGLALLDERSTTAAAAVPHKSAPGGEEAEKS